MGLKFLITVLITLIISVSLLVELHNSKDSAKAFTKNLEFTNTTFIEVNTEKMLGWTYGTHGIRDRGVLKLDDVVFHTDTIESLVAKKGKYFNKILFLDGDVVMEEKDGYTYKTQHANYHQRGEILNITSPFTAVRGKDIMEGNTLRYNTAKKKAFGTNVDAVLYTTEK